MFRKDIWRYGAVDVRDDAGRVRHGLVVDVRGKDGLIVNFDCPQHHADFIPFANIVQGQLSGRSRLTVGDAVQVLYQAAPIEPWYWHRATILAGGEHHSDFFYSYAFVEICVPNGDALRDVVGWSHVQPAREMPACHWDTQAKKNPFQRCTVQLTTLPALLAVTQRPDFKTNWSRMTNTIAVAVVDNTMVCLAPSKEVAWLVAQESAVYLSRIGNTICPRGVKRLRPDDDSGEASNRHPGMAVTIGPKGRNHILHLPVELMAEIFSFLNTAERVQTGRTCYAWHRVLQCPALAVCVRIKANHYSHQTVACIVHKMVTAATRTLIITSTEEETASRVHRASPLHIVADVLALDNRHLSRVVVASFRIWKFSLLGDGKCRAELSVRWSAVCDRLILRDTTVGVSWADRDEIRPITSMLDRLKSRAFNGYVLNAGYGDAQYWYSMHHVKTKIIRMQRGKALTVLDLVQ